MRRRRNPRRKINYTEEGEISIRPEKNKKATGLRWKRKDPRTFKFVDDGMTAAKLNMQTAEQTGLRVEGRPLRVKHDVESQNVFRRVVERAEGRGMVVNKNKTKLLLISGALTYKGRAYICLLYTSPSPRDRQKSRMPSSA